MPERFIENSTNTSTGPNEPDALVWFDPRLFVSLSRIGAFMALAREFTESWLQALTLSASNEAARRIRPWMTALGALSASEPLPDQLAAAKQLWQFAHSRGLVSLLSEIPLRQSEWRFEENELFSFQLRQLADGKKNIQSEGEFVAALAIEPVALEWTASVTQSDWTNLLRSEAVRRSKPLSVASIPQGVRVELPCTAHWDGQRWSIRFAQPDWLVLEQAGVVHAARPDTETIDAAMIDALSFANQSLMPTARLSQFELVDAPWMHCVESMIAWHRGVLISKEFGGNAWLRRVWSCVWPVVYRERNRLKGPCDLPKLRTELADCFASAPELTEWMFVFARLVTEVQWGRGLGIAADFVDPS